MDPEPTGLLFLFQVVLILLYSLLSAAESAAQQIHLIRHRPSDEDDEQFDALLQQAEALLVIPSGLRVFLLLLSMIFGSTIFWAYAQPLQSWAVDGMKWTWMTGSLMLLFITIFLLLITVFIFQLFGIVLPRRIAAQKPKGTARLLFGFAGLINKMFLPLSNLLNALTFCLLKLLRVEIMQPTEEITEDEIRMLVDVGEEKGAIEEAEREMIKNVFEFNNMTAAECMTHRTDVYAIWVGDSKEEIISLINQTGLSRFPVYAEDLDHILGTVSTRDFLLNLQKSEPLDIHDIIRDAHFVPETVRTDLLFRDMQYNKYHMAIVVDEYGGTSGLITMEDLLEEIVGNIYDEYDPQDQQDFEQLSENRWRVAGTLDVETFNEKSEQNLPLHEDYDTIGGLILSQMSSIPDDGTQPEINFEGLHFKVESVQGRRIEWVEVTINHDTE